MRSQGRLLWPAWIPGAFVMLSGGVLMVLDVGLDGLTEWAARTLAATNPFISRAIVEYPEGIVVLGFLLTLWGVWYRKGWERTELITEHEMPATKMAEKMREGPRT